MFGSKLKLAKEITDVFFSLGIILVIVAILTMGQANTCHLRYRDSEG